MGPCVTAAVIPSEADRHYVDVSARAALATRRRDGHSGSNTVQRLQLWAASLYSLESASATTDTRYEWSAEWRGGWAGGGARVVGTSTSNRACTSRAVPSLRLSSPLFASILFASALFASLHVASRRDFDPSSDPQKSLRHCNLRYETHVGACARESKIVEKSFRMCFKS